MFVFTVASMGYKSGDVDPMSKMVLVLLTHYILI